MKFYEKCISQKYEFRGNIINVRSDDILLIDGSPAKREVCEHSGGVAIVAIDNDKNIILVLQHRYPLGEDILEIPAGKLDKTGESTIECAKRELQEETGYISNNWVDMGFILPSPGFCTEKIFLFLALNVQPGESNADEGELLDVLKLPYDEIYSKISSCEINDAKTICAIFRAREILK